MKRSVAPRFATLFMTPICEDHLRKEVSLTPNQPTLMKTIVTIAFALLFAFATAEKASASLILYTQDFSSNPLTSAANPGTLPKSATVVSGTFDYQDWIQNDSTHNSVTEDLTIRTKASNGATRGAGFALDGTGLSAGDYRLMFEVKATNHTQGLGIGIYGMDFGGTHAYAIDPRRSIGQYVSVGAGDSSNKRTTLAADQMITGTGFKTVDFTVGSANAGDDLIFLFSGRTGLGAPGSFTTRIDNVTVSVVPEPSTCALMGLGLAAFGWARRSRKRPAVDEG